MLVDEKDLSVSQEILESHKDPKNLRHVGTTLTLKTGDSSDRIHVSQRPDGQLSVSVNDRTYTFNGPSPQSTSSPDKNAPPPPFFALIIQSGGGNDNITLDPNVTVNATIEAGDGDDTVQAGGGRTAVYGERGDDTIRLGSGIGYAEGNEGDDTIMGGSGDSVMYGNAGKDRMYAGAGSAQKFSHLDGGDGDDELYAGNGHTVINAGLGDDLVVAHDDSTIYTGKGRDTVWANNTKARIYAQSGDRLIGAEKSSITQVMPNDAGRKAFDIKGPDDFKQRVEDDLELLRASPAGKKMLEEMDKAAERNGAPVTIEPGPFTQYVFDSKDLQQLSWEEQSKIGLDDPKRGGLKDGVAGARADQGRIYYTPSSIMDELGTTSPIIQFYHEMSHAWNGANGTFLSGTKGPESDRQINAELQAIGLPTDTPPFDYDNDPSTPPTVTNPSPLNENSLRKEMGRPLRTEYF
jgi:Ca2+-binding RTX toxin-like protein